MTETSTPAGRSDETSQKPLVLCLAAVLVGISAFAILPLRVLVLANDALFAITATVGALASWAAVLFSSMAGRNSPLPLQRLAHAIALIGLTVLFVFHYVIFAPSEPFFSILIGAVLSALGVECIHAMRQNPFPKPVSKTRSHDRRPTFQLDAALAAGCIALPIALVFDHPPPAGQPWWAFGLIWAIMGALTARMALRHAEGRLGTWIAWALLSVAILESCAMVIALPLATLGLWRGICSLLVVFLLGHAIVLLGKVPAFGPKKDELANRFPAKDGLE